VNDKRKSSPWVFLLMRSRIPPICSEFRVRFEFRNQIRHCNTVCIKRNLYLINYNCMRTQWTTKGNRFPGSSCSCDRGFHRYLRNFWVGWGGVNTPNPPSLRHWREWWIVFLLIINLMSGCSVTYCIVLCFILNYFCVWDSPLTDFYALCQRKLQSGTLDSVP